MVLVNGWQIRQQSDVCRNDTCYATRVSDGVVVGPFKSHEYAIDHAKRNAPPRRQKRNRKGVGSSEYERGYNSGYIAGRRSVKGDGS